MSVLLEYHSIQSVTSDVATHIDNEQRLLLRERCYWAEPLFVRLEQAAPARLVGGNSLFNSGGYTTQAGEWMEVSQEEDYLMAWSDTNFIVNKLSAWSEEHAMDWSVYSSGEHIGDIVHGEPSKSLLEFLEGLLEVSTLNSNMVSEIDQKFENRCEPPPPMKQPITESKDTTSSKTITQKPWWQFW
jgi:hypothetical protein